MNELTRSATRRPCDAPPDTAGYERDFALWIDTQLEILRARKFELLDLNNVIEEFDAMGKHQRHELRSRLETLLVHLLKCQFQPDHKSGSWIATVHEQRSQIVHLLQSSPSLINAVPELAATSYAAAVRRASAETGLPCAAFPSESPYAIGQLLDLEFVP
jgi:hypothetical protein